MSRQEPALVVSLGAAAPTVVHTIRAICASLAAAMSVARPRSPRCPPSPRCRRFQHTSLPRPMTHSPPVRRAALCACAQRNANTHCVVVTMFVGGLGGVVGGVSVGICAFCIAVRRCCKSSTTASSSNVDAHYVALSGVPSGGR